MDRDRRERPRARQCSGDGELARPPEKPGLGRSATQPDYTKERVNQLHREGIVDGALGGELARRSSSASGCAAIGVALMAAGKISAYVGSLLT
jgi:hypothetical protein